MIMAMSMASHMQPEMRGKIQYGDDATAHMAAAGYRLARLGGDCECRSGSEREAAIERATGRQAGLDSSMVLGCRVERPEEASRARAPLESCVYIEAEVQSVSCLPPGHV